MVVLWRLRRNAVVKFAKIFTIHHKMSSTHSERNGKQPSVKITNILGLMAVSYEGHTPSITFTHQQLIPHNMQTASCYSCCSHVMLTSGFEKFIVEIAYVYLLTLQSIIVYSKEVVHP